MIKCLKCGDEFSYGRKISCCNSTYFGTIYYDKKKDYRWNCNIPLIKSESDKPIIKDFSDLNITEKEVQISYSWNCETSRRFKIQEEMIEKDYPIIYE
ncbi:MAG: hypothetical protein JSV62_10745 [Promethearchaeota archaeon]|nr:MAG: hypothetical protein JSV62_10745 [Candidatus Lokiarchaeota archaeon]